MRIIIFLIIAFSWPINVFAQTIDSRLSLSDTSQIHTVETTRGDLFFGRVISMTKEQISFLFKEQTLVFQRPELTSIGVYNPRFTPGNTFTPMYLAVFPTAMNLRKGEWEYQNASLLWNTLNYGISDEFSLGGGFVIPFAFTLKLKFTSQVLDKVHLGVQVQNIIPLIAETEPVSLFTFISTYGTAQKFLNFGIGYGANWNYPDDSAAYLNLGGSMMIGERFGANSELYLIWIEEDPYLLPTIGVFYQGKKMRINFGLGLINPGEFTAIFGVPILSFVQRF